MSADPAPCITDFTSAKSRLMRPGVVMRSVMPWTPESSTWSAERNASSTDTERSEIDSGAQGLDAGVGLHRAPAALEGEGTRHDADRQRAERAGDAGHDGRAAGAGAAALARGDEDHVGAAQDVLDLLRVVLGGLLADLGVGAGAEAAGQLAADVELHVRVGHEQGLGVGVDGDELDTLEADLDHAVHGVDAATTDADDLDDRQVVLRSCHGGCLSSRDVDEPSPSTRGL